jgi:alpha-1,2-mannosyltransferase
MGDADGSEASPRLVMLAGLAVAITAFAVRLWIALRGGGIGGTFGYDDGVYYAASNSLLWGSFPYRDFVLLHPPGIMLALTPFALLGRVTHDHVGFETARVAWMLLGALNATLVVHTCRRAGLVAASAGGLFYAVWTPVALTETTTRLEPLVNLGLLLALTLLTGRSATSSRPMLLWAGAALALSVSVKIWAIAPVLLILLGILRAGGPKAVGWAVVGAFGTGALVDGPFLLAAPTDMTRMVVLDQLGRGRSLVDTAARLAHVFVPGSKPLASWSPGPATMVAAGLALSLVTIVCLRSQAGGGWASVSGRARGPFALSLLGVEVLVLVLSPSFFSYYNAFAGTGLALVVACVVAWIPARPASNPETCVPDSLHRLLAIPLALATILALLASFKADSYAVLSAPFPAAALRRTASASWCVTSDSPDALILTDVLSRDLQRDCEVPVDLSGLTYDRDALPLRADRTAVPRSQNAAWQRDLSDYLLSGQSIFVLRSADDGANGAAVRHLRLLPGQSKGAGFELLGNSSSPRADPDVQADVDSSCAPPATRDRTDDTCRRPLR